MATIESLLREHVSLRVRSVDRLFLAGYVPKLQCEGQVVSFLLSKAAQLGDGSVRIPSPALLGKIGSAYVRAVERYARRQRDPARPLQEGRLKGGGGAPLHAGSRA